MVDDQGFKNPGPNKNMVRNSIDIMGMVVGRPAHSELAEYDGLLSNKTTQLSLFCWC